MTQPVKEDLIALLLRPWEPLLIAKETSKGKIAFHVPDEFVDKRYLHLRHRADDSNADRVVQIKQISKVDEAKIDKVANKIGRHQQISFFNLRHQKVTVELINVFLDQKSVVDLVSAAAYARDRVNPYLFNYALSSTILHREDTACLDIPSFVSIFPERFVEATVLEVARHEAKYVQSQDRQAIVIPRDYTGTDRDPEHRLAYFREDIGVNSHHWHWHLVYPYHGPFTNKDRRGELFYYMHRQLVARYNVERFCNKLLRVERLMDFRGTIAEAYYPKINNAKYPGRSAHLRFNNLDRDANELDIEDLEIWRDRLLDAITSGKIYKNDKQMGVLDSIDTLGDMVEASPEKSPNFQFYGNLHNEGHDIISLIHDPDNKYLENAGVMSASETAMRDPVFYRWHAFIDYIFQRYKSTLPSYTDKELSYKDIIITDFKVESDTEPQKNTLITSWLQSDVNVAGGLDFEVEGDINVRFTHLTHKDFTYQIKCENKGQECTGTCRIFISPKYNEARKPLTFKHQKLFMIELDRFPVRMYHGMNNFTRLSKDSSVTIPIDRIFDRVNTSESTEVQSDFCRCGWPDYLLLPKGTAEGFPCELFVMISKDDLIGDFTKPCIQDAFSFCGSKDGNKYPDSRAMGFPFDRESEGTSLYEFMHPHNMPAYSNMSVVNVSIQHKDEITIDKEAKKRSGLYF